MKTKKITTLVIASFAGLFVANAQERSEEKDQIENGVETQMQGSSTADAETYGDYRKLVESGEVNKENNKMMLLKAYDFLGRYEANITKRNLQSLNWFQKYRELDNKNSDVLEYISMLKKRIARNR